HTNNRIKQAPIALSAIDSAIVKFCVLSVSGGEGRLLYSTDVGGKINTMSKLRCKCDHVISDTTDNLPYKADLIPDQSFYTSLDRIEESIDSLIEATKRNERIMWIKNHFSEQYPKDLTDTQMIYDIITSKLFDLNKKVYQCENCGRIWIQKGHSDRFVSFTPENDEWKDILTAEHKKNTIQPPTTE
ncbi:hypothetical protein, partial [Cesiribacter sp. SM1]|uniref:hypothetical protein n=1 Tax=Cesiribacter sp. SM1 TaxID=2861196 RepID=UPI001CD1C357